MPPKRKAKARKKKKEESNPPLPEEKPEGTSPSAKFSWKLDPNNKRVLRLSCNDARLWSIFTSALACGTYGCTYKLEADASEIDVEAVKNEFGYSGLDFDEVVIKMLFFEGAIEDKTDKETVRNQFVELQEELELSVVSELRTQNYLATLGLAPKLFSFSVAMDCHEVAPVKKDEKAPLEYDARAATGYLQEKLFATLREVIRYCGRWYEGGDVTDDKLNRRYSIKTAEDVKRFVHFKAVQTSKRQNKKTPLDVLLEQLERSSKLIQHIHELGYLHMDFRWHLANIMVDQSIANVYAIDFGVAEYFGAPVAESVHEIGFKETRFTTNGGVPLHMGDATKVENIWHEDIIDPQLLNTNQKPKLPKLLTPRSINLVEVEADLREVYYKTFRTEKDQVNKLFDTIDMVHASILEAMIRFYNATYTQKRLKQYLGWLDRFWAIFRPFADLLDTQPSDDELMKALAALFDKMPSEQEERTEGIKQLNLNTSKIRTPAVFTHVPRLETHWETLVFVLRAMFKNSDPEFRIVRQTLTTVAGLPQETSLGSMVDLQRAKPDVFKRLVQSLFPGDSLHRLPYREMFASAYLTYNVFYRHFADRDDPQ